MNHLVSKSVASPKTIVTIGLYSSASTWAFNVVAALLHESGSATQTFSDSWRALKAHNEGDLGATVVKSHEPDDALSRAVQTGEVRAILTLRNPIDAVVSLMTRFGESFQDALHRVENSANQIVALDGAPDMPVFRFEDGFSDDPDTVRTLALWLGLDLPPDRLDAVAADFTRDAVADRIAARQADGTIPQGAAKVVFEPGTHWHPNHVNRTAPAARNILSVEQLRMVVYATANFCEVFGYLNHPLTFTIDQLRQETDEISARVDKVRDEFTRSRSWRVTRPMRAVIEALRRA